MSSYFLYQSFLVQKETLIIKKNSDKFDYIKIETNVKQTYLKSVKKQSKKDTFAVHIIKNRKNLYTEYINFSLKL